MKVISGGTLRCCILGILLTAGKTSKCMLVSIQKQMGSECGCCSSKISQDLKELSGWMKCVFHIDLDNMFHTKSSYTP